MPVLTLLAMNAIMVQAAPLPESVSADPAEDMFLAAAVAVDCIMIISGDAHQLDDSGWRGIAILTPRQFVDPYLSTT